MGTSYVGDFAHLKFVNGYETDYTHINTNLTIVSLFIGGAYA